MAAGLSVAHEVGFVHAEVQPNHFAVVGPGPAETTQILGFERARAKIMQALEAGSIRGGSSVGDVANAYQSDAPPVPGAKEEASGPPGLSEPHWAVDRVPAARRRRWGRRRGIGLVWVVILGLVGWWWAVHLRPAPDRVQEWPPPFAALRPAFRQANGADRVTETPQPHEISEDPKPAGGNPSANPLAWREAPRPAPQRAAAVRRPRRPVRRDPAARPDRRNTGSTPRAGVEETADKDPRAAIDWLLKRPATGD